MTGAADAGVIRPVINSLGRFCPLSALLPLATMVDVKPVYSQVLIARRGVGDA
jgi:hypothetical protein